MLNSKKTHRPHNNRPGQSSVTSFSAWIAVVLSTLWLAGCGPRELPVPVDIPTPTPFVVKPAVTPPTPTPNRVPVTLRYALWDPLQLPAYQACADQFMAEHPRITIEIEQTESQDYWDKLAAEMAADAAPDVFVNHLTRLPDFIAGGQVLDLEPYVLREGLDDSVYIGRLPRMWILAGERYGLPKDWDTIALVYNRELIAASGVTRGELNRLTWNPQDGGSFEAVLARLTADADGNNALNTDFDPERVAYHGLTMAGTDGGGAFGQEQWSSFAASNGFTFTDYLFAEQYHYDDPALIETFEWYQRLINEAGYHTPFEQIAENDGRQLFLDGKAAIIADGSWMISTYINDAPFDVGFARLPEGPQGRKSMLNSLADSIWSGTAHPEEAWQWVRYLGSVECQLRVGEEGVVFPAIQSGVERMLAHYDEMGVDIHVYTDYLSGEDGIFFFPVTEHVTDVIVIMQPVVEAILRGEAEPAVALPDANDRVNALFVE